MNYLDKFHTFLDSQWKGSLIRVSEIAKTEPNAKKYLGQLAHLGRIEKVIWGWYWIPGRDKDFFHFLAKDRNFKVLQKQTAAGFWNGDFIHREQFSVAVRDKSFAKAFASFAKSRGWNVAIDVRDFKPSQYKKTDGLLVETLEETIVDCIKAWAFADAFASLRQNSKSVNWKQISTHYWERIPKCSARVGQIVQYARSDNDDREHTLSISDDFLRRQVEEASERVSEFA